MSRPRLRGVSTLAIVLIAAAAVIALIFVGGLIATRRRDRLQRESYARHLEAADRALEAARAADKGWDRDLLHDAARRALKEQRPDASYDSLDLVLVDDRPGISEDRAHFLADGPDGEARVVLSRRGSGWVAERLD
jgi:hypothetical protein